MVITPQALERMTQSADRIIDVRSRPQSNQEGRPIGGAHNSASMVAISALMGTRNFWTWGSVSQLMRSSSHA